MQNTETHTEELQQHPEYLGVALEPSSGQWLAFLLAENYVNLIHLGWFQDNVSAALHRDACLLKFYGMPSSPSYMNFPQHLSLIQEYADAMFSAASKQLQFVTDRLGEAADNIRQKDAA